MEFEDIIKLREIVKRGGGIIVSAKQCSSDIVRDLCRYARASGAQIIVRNALEYSSIACSEIARLSPGNVIFDFTDE